MVAEAATIDYTIQGSFKGDESAISLPKGWSGNIRSDSKSANNVYYATVRNSKGEYLTSPSLVNDSNELVSNSVTVKIIAAVSDSSDSLPMLIKAYNSNDNEVGSSTAITTYNSKNNFTMKNDTCTITSNAGYISYLKFYGGVDGSSKNFMFDTITITYSEEIADVGSNKIEFYIDGEAVNTTYYSNGESIDFYPSSKDHYSFDGWYVDSSFTNKLPEDYVIDGTVTALYARWIEDTKYTVTYHLNSETIENEVLYVGTVIDYVPVSETLGFKGWYFDEEFTEAMPTDYKVSENIDLYASWTKLTYSIDPNNLNENAVTEKLTENLIHFQGTIFTVTRGIKIDSSSIDLPDGTRSTHRLNMGGASKWTDGDASQRTVEFTAPSNGTLTVVFASGSAGRELIIRQDGNDVLSQALKSTNTGEVATLEITEGKFYQIGAGANIYLYQVTFTPTNSEVSAKLNYQYGNDNEGDTAIRFIGTISNVNTTAEGEKTIVDITSIKLNFKLTNAEGTESKEFVEDITTIYTSIAGLDEYGEVDNQYYVVYSITKIDAFFGYKISVSMDVTYGEENTVVSATTEAAEIVLSAQAE